MTATQALTQTVSVNATLTFTHKVQLQGPAPSVEFLIDEGHLKADEADNQEAVQSALNEAISSAIEFGTLSDYTSLHGETLDTSLGKMVVVECQSEEEQAEIDGDAEII